MNSRSSSDTRLAVETEPWASGPAVWTSASVLELLPREGRPVSRLSFAPADAPEPVEASRPAPEPVSQDDADDTLMEMKLEAVRIEAAQHARRLFEVQLEQRLTEERARLDRLRMEFARDRQRYFASAESQVVRLALEIARRVLHREAASDGMHLRATVKAALARVQDGSETVLRVPEGEAPAWEAMFGRHAGGRMQVVGSERMAPGECLLETSVGRVELGISAQMDEIERGFAELMQAERDDEGDGG